MEAIEEGKRDYKLTSHHNDRRGLLCASFIDVAVNSSFAISTISSNMRRMGNSCRWCLVIYHGDEDEVANFCSNPLIKSRSIACLKSRHALSDTVIQEYMADPQGKDIAKLSVPKSILYQDLLAYTPSYERVFIMDQDICLRDFNISVFLRAVNCSPFQPPPLITQPPVAENSQNLSWLNSGAWVKAPWDRVYTAEVGSIEQQWCRDMGSTGQIVNGAQRLDYMIRRCYQAAEIVLQCVRYIRRAPGSTT